MPYVEFIPSAEVLSDERGQSVGESQPEKDRNIESTVDKGSSSQVQGVELAYHDVVGKPDDNNTYLSDDNRNSQTYQRPVMFFVGMEVVHR